MRKSLVGKSKFLSLVLRHDPGVIGLALNKTGWAMACARR
jgi:RNA:NAD 2'-phosphotransferase (TPT1/KptA family)